MKPWKLKKKFKKNKKEKKKTSKYTTNFIQKLASSTTRQKTEMSMRR